MKKENKENKENERFIVPNIFGKDIGKISKTKEGEYSFQYFDDFIQNGWNLSPITLPFTTEKYNGIPQIFMDSLPVSYEKEATKEISQIDILDIFTNIGTNVLGAIQYSSHQGLLRMEKFRLTEIKNELFLYNKDPKIKSFLKTHIVSGPCCYNALINWEEGDEYFYVCDKVLSKYNGDEWIVEISNDNDQTLLYKIAYMALAKKCNIATREIRCIYKGSYPILLLKKTNSIKHDLHFAALSGILDKSAFSAGISTEEYFRIAIELTKDKLLFHELFRRAVFHVLLNSYKENYKTIYFFMDQEQKWSLGELILTNSVASVANNNPTYLKFSINNKNENLTTEDLIALANHFGYDEKYCMDVINFQISQFLDIDAIVKEENIEGIEMAGLKKQLFNHNIFKNGTFYYKHDRKKKTGIFKYFINKNILTTR